jgi:transglutaminase-like putative cysteine protease
VRLVIVLGAAVLLLDAAAVMAFAPPTFGDGRRAAAALPLLALAVVPSTLVRPQLPYVQGLILFTLLVAFVWGERLRRDGTSAAVAVAVLAGTIGAVLAPRIDSHSPWIDYRSWAGTLVRVHVDRFDWSQTYGPLRWPRTGHQVLTVEAGSADYWKAEDLDSFDGREWASAPAGVAVPALPQPTQTSLDHWTQRLRVSITGMRTTDVIGAGYTAPLDGLPENQHGTSPGTWVTLSALSPGATYSVSSYSPHPTAAQLTAVPARAYPEAATAQYRTLAVPQSKPAVSVASFEFGRFHEPSPGGAFARSQSLRLMRSSPYARAYRLATRLARHAATPYAFVTAVKDYLAHGFTYDEHPHASAYPLEQFLFASKRGYCQQFAGAMALLLRMGGLPARVAAGFTTGAYDKSARLWRVTDTDAHAWVEVWFPRYGWVRFDPTPSSAPELGGSGTPEPITKGSQGLSGQLTGAVRRPEGAAAATASSTGAGHPGGSATWPLWLIGGVVVLVAGRLLWRRRGRPSDASEVLLVELRRAMARTGRPLTEDVTLAALERRFADAPDAAAYVRALRLNRYGAAGGPPTAAQRRALRRQLAFGLGAIGRVRALWALPPRLQAPGTGRRAS